jgi:dGTPase
MDRILYASAYRRLAGVTQVLPAGQQPLMHNRLTHTLKVQQVASRAAQWLKSTTPESNIEAAGGLDPQVAEAAAAAHDLGHPPFGHIAEDELQHLLKGKLDDSFEGNAQTFRIVTKLSARKLAQSSQPDNLGLDLSFATQAAILKYPWCRGEHQQRGAEKKLDSYYARKWGAYETERPSLIEALETIPEGRLRSLEADIMDYADDVTYAIHDIEDFFRLGFIPLHSIAQGVLDTSGHREHREVFEGFWDFATAEILYKGEIAFKPDVARDMLRRVAPVLPSSPFLDTDLDRIGVHRFISHMVSTLQEGIKVSNQGKFIIPDATRMLIEVLKQLTWYFVIEHPQLAALQQGQRRVIRDLLEWLTEWVEANDPSLFDENTKIQKIARRRVRELPARLIAFIDAGERDAEAQAIDIPADKLRTRGVVDFIASLTEIEAYSLHRRLGGEDSSGLFPVALVR